MFTLVLLCVASASANPLTRIVNGENAASGEFPHQVSLQRRSLFSWSHSCGGSILSANWILTAAHCTQSSASNFRVIVNDHDISTTAGNEETISVQEVINHESYDSGSGAYPNDISLLRLATPIQNFQAISPQTGNDVVGSTCTITGWGRTSGSGSLANILQKTSGTILSNSECRSGSYWGANINDGHICIHEPSSGACNGDSGGPMTCYASNGDPVLSGVTSWGASGCTTSLPSVYTRVSEFVDWIESKTGLDFS